MRRTCFVALLLCGIACPALPVMAGEKADTPMVSMDLDNVSVVIVAKFVGDLTEKNISVSERARDVKMTLICPEKIPVSELLKTFAAALDNNGLAMVPDGKLLKIDLKK